MTKQPKTDCQRYGHDLDTSEQPIKCRRCPFSVYSSCTIQRVYERRVGITLNIDTGEMDESKATAETVIGSCNKPLFGDVERATGICNTCAKGWVHPKNVFVNDAEKTRAIARGPGRA